jgi:hypothetical protein
MRDIGPAARLYDRYWTDRRNCRWTIVDRRLKKLSRNSTQRVIPSGARNVALILSSPYPFVGLELAIRLGAERDSSLRSE